MSDLDEATDLLEHAFYQLEADRVSSGEWVAGQAVEGGSCYDCKATWPAGAMHAHASGCWFDKAARFLLKMAQREAREEMESDLAEQVREPWDTDLRGKQ